MNFYILDRIGAQGLLSLAGLSPFLGVPSQRPAERGLPLRIGLLLPVKIGEALSPPFQNWQNKSELGKRRRTTMIASSLYRP